MALSRLQDDLLQEFREERKLISGQLELFDPLAASRYKPAAKRLLNKGLLIFFEIITYLLFLCSIAVVIFMNRLFPLYVLDAVRRKGLEPFPRYETDSFFWLVTGLIIFTGIQFFIIARIIRRIRLKNDILNLAGKHIKTLVGQHLTRKAAIDSIEQRHFTELPDIQPAPATGIHSVPNPGYNGE